MDRIQMMRTFVQVVSEGSFTKAAERLNISPQLASKYVAQLEQQLNVRLLNRSTRRLHINEAGMAYYQRAQQILADIEDMENQLGQLQSQAKGTLRITAPMSLAYHQLAPLMTAFQAANPELTVDLNLSDRKVDIIEEGYDIALRIGHLKTSSLVAKRLATVQLLFCAAPSYLQQHGEPKTLPELKQHQYIHYSYANFENNPELRENLPETTRAGSLQCNNGDFIARAMIHGSGIALQPDFIVADAIAENKLKVILADYQPDPVGLYAVFAHRQMLASKVRQFIDFASDYLKPIAKP